MCINKKNITISEASEIYGISKSTLYKLSMNREIPILKIGAKKVLIPVKEFEKWLSQYHINK